MLSDDGEGEGKFHRGGREDSPDDPSNCLAISEASVSKKIGVEHLCLFTQKLRQTVYQHVSWKGLVSQRGI